MRDLDPIGGLGQPVISISSGHGSGYGSQTGIILNCEARAEPSSSAPNASRSRKLLRVFAGHCTSPVLPRDPAR